MRLLLLLYVLCLCKGPCPSSGSDPSGTDTSTAEPPGTDSDNTEPPGTDSDNTEPPGTDSDNTEPPGTDSDNTEPPGTDSDNTEPPGTDSDNTEPPGTDSDSTEPPGTDSGNTEPPGTDSDNTEPPGTDSDSTEPPGTDSGNTEPPGTDSDNTEPPGTDSDSTEPPGTDSGNTEPPGTDSDNTEPPGTDSGNTEPPGTDSDNTEPPGTDSDSTEPPGTDSGNTEPPGTDSDNTEPPGTDSDNTEPPGTDSDNTEPPGTDSDSTEPPATEDNTTDTHATGASTTVPTAATSPTVSPTARAGRPTVVTKPTDELSVNLPFTIKFNQTFNDQLLNETSKEFNDTKIIYEKELTGVFNGTTGFKLVKVTGFWKGSTGVDYEVVYEHSAASNISSELIAATSKLKNLPDVDEGYLNTTLDAELSKATRILKEVQGNPCKAPDACPPLWKCEPTEKTVRCVSRCHDFKDKCVDGECFVDSQGNAGCRCKADDDKYVYGGQHCDVKAEKLALSSTTIIAIACGVGGGLVLILSLALLVTCCRRSTRGSSSSHKKTQGFDDQKSDVSFQSMTGMHAAPPGMTPDASRLYRQPGEDAAVAAFTRRDTGLPSEPADRPAFRPEEARANGQLHYGEDGRLYRVVKDSQLYKGTEGSLSFRNQAFESFPEETSVTDFGMNKPPYHRPGQRSSQHEYSELNDGPNQSAQRPSPLLNFRRPGLQGTNRKHVYSDMSDDTFMYQPLDTLPRPTLTNLTHINPVAAANPNQLSGFPRRDDVRRPDDVKRFSDDKSSWAGSNAGYSDRPQNVIRREEHPGAPVKVFPDRELKPHPARDPYLHHIPSRDPDHPARGAGYLGMDPAGPPKETAFPSRVPVYPTNQTAYPSREPDYPTREPDYPTGEPDYPTREPEFSGREHVPGPRGHREAAQGGREREEVSFAQASRAILPGEAREMRNPLIHDFSDTGLRRQQAGSEKRGPADRARVYDYMDEGKRMAIQRPAYSDGPLY